MVPIGAARLGLTSLASLHIRSARLRLRLSAKLRLLFISAWLAFGCASPSDWLLFISSARLRLRLAKPRLLFISVGSFDCASPSRGSAATRPVYGGGGRNPNLHCAKAPSPTTERCPERDHAAADRGAEIGADRQQALTARLTVLRMVVEQARHAEHGWSAARHADSALKLLPRGPPPHAADHRSTGSCTMFYSCSSAPPLRLRARLSASTTCSVCRWAAAQRLGSDPTFRVDSGTVGKSMHS